MGELPEALHKKLACVAKRGRFSHVVEPRVWQPPDPERAPIVILDNNERDHLDERFFKALKDFEREQEAVLIATENFERDEHPALQSTLAPGAGSGSASLLSWLKTTNPQLAERGQVLEQDSRDKLPPPQRLSAGAPQSSSISEWPCWAKQRSYMYPTRSETSLSPSLTAQVHSLPHVLVWFRFGCLRCKYNLALTQACWLQLQGPCAVIAVAIVPNGQVQARNVDQEAMLFRLRQLKTELAGLNIPLEILEGEESLIAPSLFALWTRSQPTRMILASESYHLGASRTAAAVARSINCPLVVVDTENLVPVRNLEQALAHFLKQTYPVNKDLTITESVFQSFMDSVPFPSELLLCAQPSSAKLEYQTASIPQTVSKRWKSFIVDTLEFGQSMTHFFDPNKLESIQDEHPDFLVAHVRLGTVSPIGFANKPARDLLNRRMYMLFRHYQKGMDQSSLLGKEHSASFIKELSESNSCDTKWNHIQSSLKAHLWLTSEDQRLLVRRFTQWVGKPSPDVLPVVVSVLSRYQVGFSSWDAFEELESMLTSLE